tara:strand:+ start:212 stop:622 length:411 start_codon:yes stop_codon:yes gene_type:complete
MGLKTISKLKKDLDKWFSLYIRLRNANNLGVTQCFTCHKTDSYKSLQNGHFQSRRHHTTRWNEVNCQVQCVKCNMFNQGEQFKFGIYLDAKYGVGTAESLEFKARQTIKFTRVDYMEKLSYYKEVVKNLKKEKNLE